MTKDMEQRFRAVVVEAEEYELAKRVWNHYLANDIYIPVGRKTIMRSDALGCIAGWISEE